MQYHNRRKRVEIARDEGVTSFTLSKMVGQLHDLPRSTKVVLRTMADRYPNIWPSIQTLARDAGYGTTVTRGSVRVLESKNLISAVGDKRGGRGNSEQYKINVAEIQRLLETQRELKSPETNPTESVGLTQRKALPLSLNPTDSEQKATETVEEQRSNKSFINREREERSNPLSSDQKQDHGQEILVWLVGQGLKLVPKQQTAIKGVATRYPFSVLKRASDACLSGLDIGNSWDRCEEKLTANLDLQCQAILRQDEKARQTQELIRICTENEQIKARQETEQILRKQAEEDAHIEDELPDESSLLSATASQVPA